MQFRAVVSTQVFAGLKWENGREGHLQDGGIHLDWKDDGADFDHLGETYKSVRIWKLNATVPNTNITSDR